MPDDAPAPRLLAVDGRGSGLRVTWHPDRGQAVVSLWHGDICAGTFRLAFQEAGRLAAFLASGLAAAASHPADAAEGAA